MRKFLASVGNAKLLGKVNDELQHIADVRTLTESTLSFSNTQEEIRAGEGAQLMGRVSHDSGMTVTLTDAMFDLNYIKLQTGAAVATNPSALHTDATKEISSDATVITLEKTAVGIGESCGLSTAFVWVREVGCPENGVSAERIGIVCKDGKTIPAAGTLPNGTTYNFKGKKVCAEYFVSVPQAAGAVIGANFIPAELVLILTTKLFAGDASAPETGKPIGSITVKVPRFSLDGTFDLSMAMSSAATMSLAGTALATDDGTCEGNGVYAEIVELIDNTDVTTGLKQIIVDEDSASKDKEPIIYGLYTDGHISIIDNSDCTFNPVLTGGKFAPGAYTVTVGDNTDTVTISD